MHVLGRDRWVSRTAELWAAGTSEWYRGAKVSGLCLCPSYCQTDQHRFFDPNLLAALCGGSENWGKDCSLSQSHPGLRRSLFQSLAARWVVFPACCPTGVSGGYIQ